MDEHKLDGNAVAGTLQEVFAFEVTTAQYACGECGSRGTLGDTKVYEIRGMGTIVRCPGCDSALIRLARSRERRLVDLKKVSYLLVK